MATCCNLNRQERGWIIGSRRSQSLVHNNCVQSGPGLQIQVLHFKPGGHFRLCCDHMQSELFLAYLRNYGHYSRNAVIDPDLIFSLMAGWSCADGTNDNNVTISVMEFSRWPSCFHGNECQYLACSISPSIWTARKLFREPCWMTSIEQDTVPLPGCHNVRWV